MTFDSTIEGYENRGEWLSLIMRMSKLVPDETESGDAINLIAAFLASAQLTGDQQTLLVSAGAIIFKSSLEEFRARYVTDELLRRVSNQRNPDR